MKKYVLITLALIAMVLSFASCGHKHEWSEWITATEATCTVPGIQTRTCECGETETSPIAAKGHTPGAEATCTEAQICTVCCTELTSAGHKPDPNVTCMVSQTCTVCHVELAAAKGHIPGEWAVITPPTKSEKGFEAKKCTACGEKLEEKILPAIGSFGLAYTVRADGKTCTVTGMGVCTDAEVVIPEILGGYTVTEIGERAFYGCKTITSLTVPATVTEIGADIFGKTDNLKTLYYNSDCASQENPFMRTSSIEKIVFGGSIVPYSICKDMPSLKEIVIEDSVTSIGFFAFDFCVSLTDVTFGSAVAEIGQYAFRGCTALTEIAIPDSVTEIGKYAFSACRALTDVTVGNGVTLIGSNAFYNCKSLRDITFGNNVISIGWHAFSGCGDLTNIVLPESLTEIGASAFSGCVSLTDISFSGTVLKWKVLSKRLTWNENVPAAKIVCSDGEVAL